jgi:hypothetical protein
MFEHQMPVIHVSIATSILFSRPSGSILTGQILDDRQQSNFQTAESSHLAMRLMLADAVFFVIWPLSLQHI